MQMFWMMVLASATLAKCQEGGDLDAIMDDLAKVDKTTEMPARIGVEACLTADNQRGECVNFNLCVNNDTETDGSNVIDIRELDGPCKSYLDSCCLPSDIQPKPTPKPFVPREGCGWRNPNGIGMVTVGEVNREAKFGEFPWMVAILKSQSITPVTASQLYIGGGSLIHLGVVVTGAHVVVDFTRSGGLYVRAGEWDTQTTKEPYPHQDREVANIVVHKGYSARNLSNDIALLFLRRPMILAPNVGVVCLSSFPQLPGTRCLSSGWGKDKFGEFGKYQVILKKVEVPVVEHQSCQKQLRRTRLGFFFNLHSSFMCAGGQSGEDTCVGDGGSPLVCPLPFQIDRYVQSGIVAWGIGCGSSTPGVYTDVAQFKHWVDVHMTAAGYDTSSYTVKI